MVARNTPSKSSLARCVSAPAAGSEEAARLLEVLLLPALEHLRGEGARGGGSVPPPAGLWDCPREGGGGERHREAEGAPRSRALKSAREHLKAASKSASER